VFCDGSVQTDCKFTDGELQSSVMKEISNLSHITSKILMFVSDTPRSPMVFRSSARSLSSKSSDVGVSVEIV